eukprot:14540123-Alexandrium_andersonii.AAC.1
MAGGHGLTRACITRRRGEPGLSRACTAVHSKYGLTRAGATVARGVRGLSRAGIAAGATRGSTSTRRG